MEDGFKVLSSYQNVKIENKINKGVSSGEASLVLGKRRTS